MKALWADTLFRRLFLLMWAALVGSHLLAYVIVHHMEPPRGLAGATPPGEARGLPTLGSLPPGGPMPDTPPRGLGAPWPGGSGGPGEAGNAGGPGLPGEPGPPRAPAAGVGRAAGLPSAALWVDYGVRFLVMGLAAWFGARWLSGPVKRLADAAHQLPPALAQRAPLPSLPEDRGTLEVRQAAQVFNAMAGQLHAQFDAQALLMAAVSHDLRTPLARLRLRLEALPDAGRCIDDVRQMDALIGSALQLLRERQAVEPPARIDLAALAQALVDDLAEQGEPIRLETPADAMLHVQARSAALTRVLGNLFSNALKHGRSEAGVGVHLQADAQHCHVHVDDAGPGIAAGELAAVFQPWYRADPARGSGGPPGAGLGLFIARDLIQREGGQVALAPRPGGGLRATVSLPRLAAPGG